MLQKKRGWAFPDKADIICSMQSHAQSDDGYVSSHLGVRRWLAVAAIAVAFYTATAQRGVSWQDSGEFQWRCLTGDIAGTMGLARAHPAYVIVGGWLTQVAGPATPFVLNAFSGLGMGLALATFAAVACRVSRSRVAGLLTATLLGVCHTAWWLSTIAEVYTWSLAALVGEIYLLLRLLEKPDWRWLSLLALVNGLHLCVHNFALLDLFAYLPVIGLLLIRGRLSVSALLPAAALWFVGAGLFLGMTVEMALTTGSTSAAIRSALVGDYATQVANVGKMSKHFMANAALVGMNFVNPLLPLAIIGWRCLWRGFRRDITAALLLLTLVHVAFFIRYPVPDQFTFVLPSLTLIALAGSVGLAWLLRRGRICRIALLATMVVSIAAQPVIFVIALEGARHHPAAQRQRSLPYRDEARYWLIPWKQNESSAVHFSWAAMQQVESDALIWPENTSVYPLMTFQQLHNLRPSVAVQYDGRPVPEPISRETMAGLIHRRPVYVVAPTVQKQFVGFGVIQEGVLYRLVDVPAGTSE